MTYLTHLILCFKATGQYYQRIQQLIMLFVYQFRFPYRGFSDDHRSDFLLYLLEQIPQFLKRYAFYGTSFESYLLVIIRWQAITFIKKHQQQLKRKQVVDFSQISETDYCHEESPSYSNTIEYRDFWKEPQPSLQHAIDKSESFRRRIVILALKSCRQLSSEQLARVAVLTGYRIEWLTEASQSLQLLLEQRSTRLNMLRHRRNRAFMQILSLQSDLSSQGSPDERVQTTRKIGATRQRMQRLCQTIAHLSQRPTNVEIARLMGIPKGTVDSGMCTLKQKLRHWQIVAEDTDLESKNIYN